MPIEGQVGVAAERPIKPALIFDSECEFCRRWVARARKWDRNNRVTFLPLQDPRAVQVSDRDPQELKMAAHLVRPDGTVFAGAAAARELLAFLPFGRVPRLFMDIPGVMRVAARLYAWVARRYGPVD